MRNPSIWKKVRIPDLTGKVILITGGSSGIGREAGAVLAEKNATVILACRDHLKFDQAVKGLPNKHNIHFIAPLDLADRTSIETFATAFKKEFHRLDVLVNNAGIMNAPSAPALCGVENQFGVNHLGHFLLCGLLLEVLTSTQHSRVINVASCSAHDAVFDPSLVFSKEESKRIVAYKFSKLANLYFTYELDEQFKKNSTSSICLAVHPGYVKTRLQRHTKGILRKLHVRYTQWRFAQNAASGVLPILRAATEEKVSGKSYFYPDAPNGLSGNPIIGVLPEIACNESNAKEIWRLSEDLLNFTYTFKS
jgi:NAD(P)-dependent dehydrogenase (short-subunit alcohol dehydrogenase family)